MSFQLDLSSEEAFKLEVLEVPGTLQVVEVYQPWCGPCKAVQSTFRRIYFDMGDKPLKFFTANAEKITAFREHVGKCQPVFLFFKDGIIQQKIVGVNAPDLERAIMSRLETKPAAAPEAAAPEEAAPAS